MKKISPVLSVTLLVLGVLSFADEYFKLNIPMYRWTYNFTNDERWILRFNAISTALFYFCMVVPMMREMDKNKK